MAASGPVGVRRLGPPPLDRGQILRPRLLARVARRRDLRVLTVTGGPGFGKSTLLGQAYAENLLAPLGTDHWLTCDARDADADVFVASVLAATGLDALAGVVRSADGLAERLGALAPGTCLILDDVHEIPVGSAGHDVLRQLVVALPHQCSLVLGARALPDLPLAELRAKGRADVLTEADLAYTDDEVAQLARRHGVDPQMLERLGTLGGWPALVELALATGVAGSESYLREAVLASLSEAERRRLAVLEAIGGGDPALVSAALGGAAADGPPPTFDAFAAVPALQTLAGGGLRPHALWQAALSPLLDADERRLVRRRAAAELLRRGRHDDAADLYERAGDPDGVCAVIVDACVAGTWRYPLPTLQRWRRALPPEFAHRPEAKVLDGIAGREGATFHAATTALLVEAADSFRDGGDVGAEVATLGELGFVAREQGDAVAFMTAAMRLLELHAGGRPEAAGLMCFVNATLAEEVDDDEAILASFADIESAALSRQWRSRADWMRGHSEILLGRPERGLALAERSRDGAEDDFLGARYLVAYARWWSGVDARAVASLPCVADEPYRTPFDAVYGGGVFAALLAYAGRTERARRSLDVAVESARVGEGGLLARPEYVGILDCAHAALAVAEGDEERAAARLRDFFDTFPASEPTGRRVARRLPGLVHVLLPEQRAAIEAAPYGDTLDAVRAVAVWFSALRDGRPGPPPPGWTDRLLNALPLRWAVEAVARCVALDPDEARLATERLVAVHGSEVRGELRRWAEAPGAPAVVRDGARRLLAAVPVGPAAPVSLRLFGPFDVLHGDGAPPPYAAADLRRLRVRQLIAALVVLGPTTRERLGDLLWPDLDRAAAGRNLRTTLNYVHRILEPDRGPGDAAFVLRQRGEHLSLAGAPWVDVDLDRFAESVRAAREARAGGAHSEELDHLERALALVRGEPLADVAFDDWASTTVHRLTADVTESASRAASLWFALGAHDRAQDRAQLALRFDRWCDPAHHILVATLVARGNTRAAIGAYREWLAARAELGLTASPDMQQLARRLGVGPAASGGPADAAAR